MQDTDVFKRLKQVQNLPTLPVVIEELRKALQDPYVDAKVVSHIMSDDPSLMTNIIKLANSSLYGSLSKPVTSLQLAVARLGFKVVNNIALSSAIFSLFDEINPVFNRELFWKHCICVGITMNLLYERSSKLNKHKYSKDTLQLCGLLHDIGRIILEQYFHDELVASIDRSTMYNQPLYKTEDNIFGTNHAVIGAWLAKKWELPEMLCMSIRYHHHPDEAPDEYKDLSHLVHLADYFCNFEELGSSGVNVDPSFQLSTLRKLGIEIRCIPEIIEQAVKNAEQSKVLMAIVQTNQP